MSRSWKKAIVKDGYGSRTSPPTKKFAKRMAAKAVRRFTGQIPQGGWYKRLYCQWSICDWFFDLRWNTTPRTLSRGIKRQGGTWHISK